MYWNLGDLGGLWREREINRNMRCIETFPKAFLEFSIQINRNMRCIETAIYPLCLWSNPGLIETWDVLKLFMRSIFLAPTTINRNMRCIETFFVAEVNLWCLINRNMRCIETLVLRLRIYLVKWLIETWDVLKL